MIESNLPALQVVIPLLGAVVCALLPSGRGAWLVALVVSWSMPLVAAALLAGVMDSATPLSYAMGGWAPPWGIEYRVDIFSAFMLFLVSAVGAVLIPYARDSVAAEIDEAKQPWFYCMYLLCLTGLLGIVITGDAFNAFVFLEVSSLASYALIALGKDRRALLAAYQYLVMGTIGATFYVIGVGMLYSVTGTLNMVDLAARLPLVEQVRPVYAGLAFITVGVGLKLALFPLHVWLPNAYAYAPSVATIFIAATATKVAVYLLFRYFFTVFGLDFVFETVPVTELFIALSLAAMFGASLVAVFQQDIKRMLAYSSVAQIGYITLGLALANQAGLTGAIVHLMNHAVMKAALFMAVCAVFYRIGSVKIDDMAGIGRKMPATMAGFAIAGLALVGTPGTVGFISKWYLAVGAIDKGMTWLVFLLVLSSLISVIYIGRVVEVAWFRAPSKVADKASEPPLLMMTPMMILVVLTVYLGLDTSLTAGIASRAAEILLVGLP